MKNNKNETENWNWHSCDLIDNNRNEMILIYELKQKKIKFHIMQNGNVYQF